MSPVLRRGQIIGNCGPGAIVDIGDESFVTCSIDHWKNMAPCLLSRLALRLGVLELKQPVTNGNVFGGIPESVTLCRFPKWMFCQSCRRMDRWNLKKERELLLNKKPSCNHCNSKLALVPMRFVQICEEGHLGDVDWNWWVHCAAQEPCQNRDASVLKFIASGDAGSGLGSLSVKCSTCRAIRYFGDIKIPMKCSGLQPWQQINEGQPCEAKAVVVQRGDSNVYFPNVISALDLPAEVLGGTDQLLDLHRNNPLVEILKGVYRDLQAGGGDTSGLDPAILRNAIKLGIDPAELRKLIISENLIENPVKISTCVATAELKAEEFIAISQPSEFSSSTFCGSSYKPSTFSMGTQLSAMIESVSLISRLREVRAFSGFHRMVPGGAEKLVPAALRSIGNWLPACEVFGEGIFIRLSAKALDLWIRNLSSEEINRVDRLGKRILKQGIHYLPPPSPILLAVHSLSHALIRQLSFDCGYASSSLRERIYCDTPDRTGILIYTADGDSEGTLGGLIRQGQSDRLQALMGRALQASSWCSGDPLCREGENQGMAGLNRAACHACLLVSETSCEFANVLLDRRLLVGDEGSSRGLFNNVMQEMGIS